MKLHLRLSFALFFPLWLLLMGCIGNESADEGRDVSDTAGEAYADDPSDGADEAAGERADSQPPEMSSPTGDLPDPDELDPDDTEGRVNAVIACMESKGYAAQRDGGGVRFPPTSDTQGQREAIETCTDRYTAAGPEVTPEWLGRLHDARLEAAECLREQGVDVPDPPSREAFIEDPDWSPHRHASVIAGYTEAEARRLEDACPQPRVE